MRILVTGGNGFIGRFVVDKLLEAGHETTIFDHLLSIDKHSLRQDVNYICASVTDEFEVMTAVQNCDGVIHLAGVLGTSESMACPRGSVATNVLGSLNVFEACRRFSKKCVYITVGNSWMNNPYSITKTTAERFAWMFNREHQTKISVVRALNAYGPHQKSFPVRKIIPNFILPALRGGPLTVYGNGTQIMDMIYVEDVADVLVRALLLDHDEGYEPRSQLEAGTGRYTTVLSIAEKVIELVGKGEIRYEPMRPGELPGSTVVGRLETLKPLYDGSLPAFTTLEDGLRKTIEYYRSNLVNLPQASQAVAL